MSHNRPCGCRMLEQMVIVCCNTEFFDCILPWCNFEHHHQFEMMLPRKKDLISTHTEWSLHYILKHSRSETWSSHELFFHFLGVGTIFPWKSKTMTLNMSKILNHGCQSNINMLENKHLSRLMSGTSGIASLHPKSLAFSNNGTHKHPAELENAKIRPSFACEIGSKKVNRPVGLHLSARLVGF